MTNIKYETEIIRVLHAAGQEGLSVQKISLHVRNACSSLLTTRHGGGASLCAGLACA